MNLNKKLLSGAVLLALAGGAQAALTITPTVKTFIAQEIAGNTSVIVPSNLSIAEGAAGELALNAVVQVKLPSGLLWKQNPTLDFTVGVAGVATIQGTATGTDTAIFKITTASTTAGTYSVGNVLVTGTGGPLASATTSNLSYTLTISGATVTNGTTSQAAFAALDAFAFGTPSAADTNEGPTVDILTASGKKYNAGGSTTVTFAELNSSLLSITQSTGLNHLGTSFSFSGSPTQNATITGNLTGISSIYLVSNATACATSVPSSGAVTGTIASDKASASFTGLTNATAYHACVIADGSTLLPESTFKVNYTASDSSTSIGNVTASKDLTSQTYNGSTSVSYYVNPPSNTANPSYIRLYNTGSASADVSGILYTDAGTATSFTSIATLPAKGALLLSPSDLSSKFGAWSGKGTVKWFANKTGNILTSQSVLINTSGVSNMTSSN